VLVLTRHEGSAWLAAACGGAICGVLLSIAWAIHLFLPKLSALFLVIAAAPPTAVWLFDRQAGAYGLSVAGGLYLTWFLIYDVAFTGRYNAEAVKELVTLGGDGRAGRARNVAIPRWVLLSWQIRCVEQRRSRVLGASGRTPAETPSRSQGKSS
jgi:hypothetical protein